MVSEVTTLLGGIAHRKRTVAEAIKEASLYKNKAELRKKNLALLHYLYRYKLLDQVKFKEDNGTTA